MFRTLIIPDLHLRWEDAQLIIDKVPHEQIIFLGDFFDDFNDTPLMFNEMCDWLEDSTRKPNRIHLWGNHDVHYARADRRLVCSGYAQWKYFIVHDNFEGKKVWDDFKFFHILDGKWLISHAGIHKFWVPEKIVKLREDRPAFLRELSAYLKAEETKGWRAESWFLESGHSRGGSQRVGGIIWCDFEKEFHPVLGLNQVFGHTPQQLGHAKWCNIMREGTRPQYIPIDGRDLPLPDKYDDPNRSFNFCLDVWKNTWYALWDGSQWSFGNVRALKAGEKAALPST